MRKGCEERMHSKVNQRTLVLYLQLSKLFITILTVCLLLSFLCSSSRKIEKLRKRNPTASNSVSDSGNALMIDAFLVKEKADFVLIFLPED